MRYKKAGYKPARDIKIALTCGEETPYHFDGAEYLVENNHDLIDAELAINEGAGGRLNGANRYVVTFPKGQTPPVHGFWSLTLYNDHHFFAPNDLKRYSLGTKNKTLKQNSDGSLTIYVQADPPPEAQRVNWLPAPKNADFSLFMRAYWPKAAVVDGSWVPPAVEKAK